MALVGGPALKALIEEEFGDGIMSAIDFDMDITRKADPKGDRVQIGMTDKSLPYKYDGAKGKRIEIGTAVIDIHYENPLYMAEDAGAADLIAGSRLQLGISRGSPE